MKRSRRVLPALCWLPLLVTVAARAEVYQVGPGLSLAELDEVPWESLHAGDEVVLHWRAEAYRSKVILAVPATEQQPLVFRGVPGPQGQLPVIDGRDATTRAGINFWNEDRGVVKIGGANNPDCDPPACVPSWIVLENLDIRSGRPPYQFSGRSGTATYADNAAAVYVEVGRNIVIRNCRLHDSGNGLFIGVFGGETRDILVEGNHLFGNGIVGSIYQHNSYTSARGIVFQFNHYGPLCDGCLGNNLKDRSAGLVVRYNWIEDGNRQLDLVDGEDSPAVPGDPAYRQTFVYGNVLVEGEGQGNSQIVHYGGDSGDTSIYRKGTLYFYHNTVVSTRSGNTTLLRLSTNDEHADLRNNIVYAAAGGSRLALLGSAGVLDISHNWFNQGWRVSHDSFSGTLNDDGSNLTGDEPGFVDAAGQDFHLASVAAPIDAGGPLAVAALEHPVDYQYRPHQAGESRPRLGAADLGAFEYCPPGGCAGVDGGSDGGAADGGSDAGAADAEDGAGGEEDAGVFDAGPADAGGVDGGGTDAGGADATAGDDSPADAGDEPAAGDTGVSGADTGGGPRGSCACTQGEGRAAWPLVPLLLVLLAGRRRRNFA